MDLNNTEFQKKKEKEVISNNKQNLGLLKCFFLKFIYFERERESTSRRGT